jgi:two-component system sensor histidine kinase KdpD
MAHAVMDENAGGSRRGRIRRRLPTAWPTAGLLAGYGASLVMVVFATAVGLAVEAAVGDQNVTLVFVLPVVVAASAFGWGPAIAAVIASALAFDFFFTEPKFTLRIDTPSDMWAAGLLLVTAALVSAVGAQARRRALQARAAADQAEAVRGLAHAIIEDRPQLEVLQTAADALGKLFAAPTVVFLRTSGGFRPVAGTGSPQIRAAEDEAAQWVLTSGVHARAESYPFDRSEFDFWPVPGHGAGRCVLGVDFRRARDGRPLSPEKLVDVVAGYVAVALGHAAEPSDG